MAGTQALRRAVPPPRMKGTRLLLGALPSAVPCARAHTRAVLATWGVPAVAGNAEVVVTELVTNALTHGSQGHESGPIPVIQLDLLLSQALIIDVWDCSPEPPVMRGADTGAGAALGGDAGPGADLGGLAGTGESGEPAEGGRGLLLVSALCASWHSDIVDGWDGKRVRAILPVH